MDLLHYFDRVVLLNLKRRPDRLAQVQRELEKAQWPFLMPEIFEAVDAAKTGTPANWAAQPGAWGCMASHRRILEQAVMDDVGRLLVLEDDVCFVDGFAQKVADFLARVPEDWDLLMLGGQHYNSRPVQIAEGLWKCVNTHRTHCFAVSNAFMRPLYAQWQAFNGHLDHLLGPFAGQHKAYCPVPFLAGQAAGKSEIMGKQEPVRFWDEPASAPGRDVPVVWLHCSRQIADQLRDEQAIHTGFWRDAETSIDNGLLALIAGQPSRGPVQWAGLLKAETAAFPQSIVAAWHPSLPAPPECLAAQVSQIISAASVDDARRQIKLVLRRSTPTHFHSLDVFYHIACMNNWQEVVIEQLGALMAAELDVVVHAGILGGAADLAWCRQQAQGLGIVLDATLHGPDLRQYEVPTLAGVHRWAKANPPCALLYMHTKGVSNPSDPNKAAWRRLMQRYVIGDWRQNLKRLELADAVGVDWQDGSLPHFSGNFWMARADWVAGLPDLGQFQASRRGTIYAGNAWERMCAELWLGSVPGHEIVSLRCRNTNLWSGNRVHELLRVNGGQIGPEAA